MAHINWLESHYCHIDTIDEQHINILKLINQLDDTLGNRDQERIGQLLSQLITTIIGHFEFEEALMATSGYGHLKAHKRLHDRFAEKLLNFSHRFDNGECIIEELHPFLQEWFRHHIEEDKDYCLSAAAELNAGQAKKRGWFARTFGGGG